MCYLHYRLSGAFPPKCRERLPELLRTMPEGDWTNAGETAMHMMVQGCLARRFFPDPSVEEAQAADGSRRDCERAEYLAGAMGAMLEAGLDAHAPDAHGTSVVQLLRAGRRQYSREVAELAGSRRVGDVKGLLSMVRAINEALEACGKDTKGGGAAGGGATIHVGAGVGAGAGLATPGPAAGKKRQCMTQASPLGQSVAVALEGGSPAAAAPHAPRKRPRSDGEGAASTCGAGVHQGVRRALDGVKLERAAASLAVGPAAVAARVAVKPEPEASAAVVGPCGSAARLAPGSAVVKREPCSGMGSAARVGATVKQELAATPAASVCSRAARTAALPQPKQELQQEPKQELQEDEAEQVQEQVPVMPFGQYWGRPLTHLPASYVCWLCQQEGIFQHSVQRQDLCMQLLDAGIIRAAEADAVSPGAGHPYLSGYEPVWRVAPATPEELQEAREALVTFGQHRGERVAELPSDYIGWMCRQPGFWDLDQARKRVLLRQLEVLGRVGYTRAGQVVLAAAERTGGYASRGVYKHEVVFRGFGSGGWGAEYDCDFDG
ncbi:hypothetical protein CHLRE_07g353100v5 [Chlamydomonas reinhardtii]|uniref:Uncharacterized protein n=1 Tax=Chlamydomonas reinhardtii TaxID=3055 RepID=A0A2K3DLH0_CHLRE|nr:uncharacterized protein CHLRE_07g353100v5 [Chlamydomonas reinhardtii]PNW81368.1 hypothetical protein CHLRE_07g353100v5 [Chlamydomonas reinhardtii]